MEYENEISIINSEDIRNIMNIYLESFLKNKVIADGVDLSFLLRYRNEDRKFQVDMQDDKASIYIATSKKDTNSCLITLEKGLLRVQEMCYKRVGNGVNQEGTLTTRIFYEKSGRLIEEAYAITLFNLGVLRATLLYTGDLNDLSSSFSITVDAKTLDGYGEERKITDTLNENCALDLFRKGFLNGENIINGLRVQSSSEDMEKQTQKINRL